MSKLAGRLTSRRSASEIRALICASAVTDAAITVATRLPLNGCNNLVGQVVYKWIHAVNRRARLLSDQPQPRSLKGCDTRRRLGCRERGGRLTWAELIVQTEKEAESAWQPRTRRSICPHHRCSGGSKSASRQRNDRPTSSASRPRCTRRSRWHLPSYDGARIVQSQGSHSKSSPRPRGQDPTPS